ncbi:glycosyltransferase family A protein [Cereibacter changlensis]|uniref:glycosyltransferase family A protein n=1 Tax=Cereibacter changlensis TaxID=402884 RepID=UPI004034B770
MTRIAIGVCTFRRPGLAETLASLSALDWPEGLRGEIIVADNDETPSAEALVARYAETAPLPVQYIHAPARNISVARNAVLEAAAERDMALLAFLDDDETVAPNWIAALWAARLQTGAEAVLGPVRAHHAPDAPGWMREGAIHDTRPVFLPGGAIKSGYTCNVLLDLAAPRRGRAALRSGARPIGRRGHRLFLRPCCGRAAGSAMPPRPGPARRCPPTAPACPGS